MFNKGFNKNAFKMNANFCFLLVLLCYTLISNYSFAQKDPTKNSLTISIKVYESHELNMAILGYGAGVQVLAPKSYISYIKGVANGIVKLYDKK